MKKLLKTVDHWWSFYRTFTLLYFPCYLLFFLASFRIESPARPDFLAVLVATTGALWCWKSVVNQISLKKICKIPFLLLFYFFLFSLFFVINGWLVCGILSILPPVIWYYGQIVWYYVVVSISSFEAFPAIDRLNNWFEA